MYTRFIRWASCGSPGLAFALIFLSFAIPAILVKAAIVAAIGAH
jgi:hypothetical protein